MTKYEWTEATFASIFWAGIGRARQRGSPTQLMQTSKILHGWLPVNHMLGHMTQITQCPGCQTRDETFYHLFRCPHPQMQAAIAKGLSSMDELLKKAIPQFPQMLYRWGSRPYNSQSPRTRSLPIADGHRSRDVYTRIPIYGMAPSFTTLRH